MELESAAIQITIISYLESGEEITFDVLKQKLMIQDLTDLEKARILARIFERFRRTVNYQY